MIIVNTPFNFGSGSKWIDRVIEFRQIAFGFVTLQYKSTVCDLLGKFHSISLTIKNEVFVKIVVAYGAVETSKSDAYMHSNQYCFRAGWILHKHRFPAQHVTWLRSGHFPARWHDTEKSLWRSCIVSEPDRELFICLQGRPEAAAGSGAGDSGRQGGGTGGGPSWDLNMAGSHLWRPGLALLNDLSIMIKDRANM